MTAAAARERRGRKSGAAGSIAAGPSGRSVSMTAAASAPPTLSRQGKAERAEARAATSSSRRPMAPPPVATSASPSPGPVEGAGAGETA